LVRAGVPMLQAMVVCCSHLFLLRCNKMIWRTKYKHHYYLTERFASSVTDASGA
jgi:hypothetical protein